MQEVAAFGSDTRFAERRNSACETADTAYVMLSVRLQCVDCYFTMYVVTWPTSKYHTGPSPMIGEATISACYSVIKHTP